MSPALPARDTLPGDVQIPSLPGVGTTWYDRGHGYWPRRARTVLLLASLLAVIGLIDRGLFAAIHRSSQTGFVAFVSIDAALAVSFLAFCLVRAKRRWNVASLPRRAKPPASGKPGRTGSAVTGFMQLAWTLLVLASAFLCLVCPVMLIALLIDSLLPEPLGERQARLWITERLAQRGA